MRGRCGVPAPGAGPAETHFRRAQGPPPLGMLPARGAIAGARRLGGRPAVVQADGAAWGGRSLEDAIGAPAEGAFGARAMRRAASAGEWISLLEDAGRLPKARPAERCGGACRRDRRRGGPGGARLWHAALLKAAARGHEHVHGTGIAMRRGGLLLPCEPRHLHALRPGRGARPAASAAIAAAPRQGAGRRRTERRLSRLPVECVGAAGPCYAGAVLRRARIIDGALSARSAYACAAAVPGARRGGWGAGSVGRAAPRPGRAAGTAGPASAAVSGIAGLREAAALLIGRCR